MPRLPEEVARLARTVGRWARTNRYLVAMVAAYSLVIGSVSTYRFYTGQSYAWDLGIMQQALYSAAFHGRFFYYTPELFNKNPSGSYFGVHCSLLMFPLAGFYRVFPSAPALLFLQAFAVACAAFPLVRLCRALNCPHPGLFAALYLLSPLTILSNLYDFHLEAFVPFGVFLLLSALVRQRAGGAVVAAAYLLSVYEYGAVFVVGCVGVYALLRYRDILRVARGSGVVALAKERTAVLCAGLFVAAVGGYLLSFSVIYSVNPTLRGLNGTFSPSVLSFSLSNLSSTGPWAVLLYFGLPFLILAFLPFRDLRPLLLVAPFALPALFSTSSYYLYGYQYGLLVVPGYILAAALGYRRAAARPIPRLPARYSKPVLASLSAASVVVIVVVASTTSYGSWFGTGALLGGETAWNAASERLAATVPAGASVLVDDNAFPWVANDLQAYVIPIDIEPSPVSFFDTISSTLHVDPEYILLNTIQYGLFPFYQNLSSFVFANYGPLAEDYGVLLLKWHYTGPMTFYRGYSLSFGAGAFIAEGKTTSPYYAHGPYTQTIVGNYSWTVDYRANASGPVRVNVTAFDGTVLLSSTVVPVSATPSGAPAAFTVDFTSPHPYDGVEVLVMESPAVDLSVTGATLTETGP